MKTLLLSLSFAVLMLAGGPVAWAASQTRQIWFNMPNYTGAGQQDWNQFFGRPNAPWPDFMNHVQVLAVTGVPQIPDGILAKTFTKLNQKHISFAVDSQAQSWVNEAKCGQGVESYTDPPANRRIANKIQSDGGQLVYIAMDEPLWFGHYYDGHNACQSTIDNVAKRAAAILHEYTKVFPNVIIGDIEPFPALTSQPHWQNDYKAWMSAFNTAVGQPIAFLHVDINWPKPDWQTSVRQIVNFAGSAQLPIGVIYNGNVHGDPAPTSRKWLDSGVQNFTVIETKLGVVPDQVIFHTWEKFPTHSISDANELGLDYLVDQYVKTRLH